MECNAQLQPLASICTHTEVPSPTYMSACTQGCRPKQKYTHMLFSYSAFENGNIIELVHSGEVNDMKDFC